MGFLYMGIKTTIVYGLKKVFSYLPSCHIGAGLSVKVASNLPAQFSTAVKTAEKKKTNI
jgi:hypothetical protein